MTIASQNDLLNALGGKHQRIPILKANLTGVAGRQMSLWSPAGQPGVGSTTLGQAAAGAVPTNRRARSRSWIRPTLT